MLLHGSGQNASSFRGVELTMRPLAGRRAATKIIDTEGS